MKPLPTSPEFKLGLILGIALLLIDLVLKSLTETVILNSGTVLGIGIPNLILTVAHVIIFTAVLILLLNQRLFAGDQINNFLVFTALVASLSNLLDRIFIGGVRDYLVLGPIWFNIADAAITSAIILTIVRYFYAEIYSSRKRKI